MLKAFFSNFPYKKFCLNLILCAIIRLLTKLLISPNKLKNIAWQECMIDILYVFVMSIVFTFLLKKKHTQKDKLSS